MASVLTALRAANALSPCFVLKSSSLVAGTSAMMSLRAPAAFPWEIWVRTCSEIEVISSCAFFSAAAAFSAAFFSAAASAGQSLYLFEMAEAAAEKKAAEKAAAAEKKAQEQINSISEQVRTQISQGNAAGALKLVIAEVPATKEEDFKTKQGESALAALNAVKTDTIPRFLDDCNPEELANLMKYVYKAMSITGSANLLAWHAAIVNNSGIGIICRAMADRKV